MTTAVAPGPTARVDMTHRQIMEALSGLLLGLFVAILSSTVVSNALPTIIKDIGGGQAAYTWVVTATLLATTATTPIWGKLADLFSKKLLVQLSLVIFVLGSAVAGLSQSPGLLIGARVVQGIGAGGLTALTQVCLAVMIPPRERGRYSGYLGAVFALATVAGPLIGGAIVDTSWLGWHWCFYVGVPFAVVALVVLQKTLHLPTIKRDGVTIDWLGATLIMGAVSVILIWVTLAGHNFDWASWQTFVMVPGAVVLGVLFVVVESRAKEPILPLWMFRVRTITLAILASLFVGVAMFGATVYLSQYFQLSRGSSPLQAGLETIPLIGGLFLSSLVSGRIISRTGTWKAWLVSGTILVTAGFGLLSITRQDTDYWLLAVFMAVVGVGVGMALQNLVLSVQNVVPVEQLGVASAGVAFFRSLGGAVGVSVLGAILSNQVNDHIATGLAEIGVAAPASTGTTLPDYSTLPAPVVQVIENAYGIAVGHVFLVAAPIALLAVVAVLFIKEIPLRLSNATAAQMAEGADDAAAATVEREAPVDIRLSTTGLVSGTVTADGTGRPLADATVTVIDATGAVHDSTVTGADGRYEFAHLLPGTWTVVASGYAPVTAAVETARGSREVHDFHLTLRSTVGPTARRGRHARADEADPHPVTVGR